MWLSGTRAGGGLPRWCTSDVPMGPHIKWLVPFENFTENDIYMKARFDMQKKTILFYFTQDFKALTLCEP
jgi:hypothetical protein